ncbi:NAD(P)-dependent oxidoreductase [Rhizobium rhizogenes]|uniref:NAD-dependent epimerase/dehydratase family protein n=1 Tax=Rhizobium rhizogenes TaxID=359 RepID=UPI00056589AB|nr:NAD(P)-dependent oxidoreductase [Rhizobium rhizogenes]NTF82178.1 NAD(P)-dependent oxidoreductase [Rhizobium rhizogenes]NTH78196.1 NAD(P)-dependent oxidoreductase [Rhizobium rhizogenes]NTH84204.1 NAD(P)-dependent oxidoreductase [Rhizobium rhizogenes]NTI23323.1 NAD(P)-dependent oxidoreductase [Rhizobium rhizogenes]NTI75606.1 NAD(P)-dependent oxidoreductase [Rhizobium rhizogenes]
MAVLVTGSSGYLGEALIRTLKSSGQAVRGIDIKPSAFTDNVGSIADRGFVREAMVGIHTVLHAATLHKPHIATSSNQDFLDTNLTGTLNLLEEAVSQSVERFVFTSTTSAFGAALTPAAGAPAAWITEEVVAAPRNIYGITKIAAENLCELFHRLHKLPVIVLRVSRFFPGAADNTRLPGEFSQHNLQANEFLYRRADIADVVSAHLLAAEKAKAIGFGRYIISATTPFEKTDLTALRRDTVAVVQRLFPDFMSLYAERDWKLFTELDRVYVNQLAKRELGWQPAYDFHHVLACLEKGEDFRSRLAIDLDIKDAHPSIAEGRDPVE